ncbi:ATP-binding region ATPase domain protein [Gemmatirosa kalamazoonensis]|uniref:histidine kinase n=1 Tax=Gemmatirosa kalamazoonensis TaxID=861299 RepID=W0RBL7_9BACT|nr:ATP-binding protein [Gemmatirosa kalamazoonensis]AHG87700.1 ATP-binding region ATPase domain protein [Gemmatirosa kalamazoonensis]
MIHDPVLAHEIRTPLHGVLAAAELLDDGALSAEQRGHVETIREAARALLALADDALTVGRDARDADATCDVRETVHGVSRLLAPAAAAKGLTLLTRIDLDVPAHVRAAAGPLRQILVNLVGNAVKYTATGGVTVRVRRDGASVALEVHDTGPGLPTPTPRAFEPAAPNGGAGLGLTIAAALVRRLGGTLEARSTPHEGTVFSFTVRAAVVASTAVTPSAATGDGPSAAATARLLVVDDDPVGRRVTAGLLARLGHRVDVAATVAEARAALDRATYDALFLDCALPDGDGCDVALALRRAEGNDAHTRIVALTASPDAAVHARCLDAGVDACLVKPADLADLAAALAPRAIDPATLDALARLENDAPGLLARVADDYARAADEALGALRRAIGAGDRRAAVEAAHRLRGSSASAGAAHAATLAGAVERAALRDARHVDASLLRALERAVVVAGEELQRANTR